MESKFGTPTVARDGSLYALAFKAATRLTEDQLLSLHMAPMLLRMGTNVRAILHHHALNRAGLEKSPLRDALSNLHPILNEVIEHDWLHEVDFNNLQQFMGDHPKFAETCSGRKFRQLLWDLVGCEASVGDWQQFSTEEKHLILYASFYEIEALERVPYQKGTDLMLDGYEVSQTQIMHSAYPQGNSYSPTGEDGNGTSSCSSTTNRTRIR